MSAFISWNVNGIKSTLKQGFLEFVKQEKPDFLCLQEIKSHLTELDDKLPEYHVYWNPAQRKGYAGTVVFSKPEALSFQKGMNNPEFDNEGRVITLEYDTFYLVTVYTVNAQRGLKRLDYRMKWDEVFRNYVSSLDKKKPVIMCGDFNVAHKEIDLANPKANRRNAGFTDEEREGFTKLLDAGFVDTFRHFDKSPGKYTWWSMRTNARERNIGWRIDYFLVSERLLPKVQSSEILSEVYGSDHCPIKLVVDI